MKAISLTQPWATLVAIEAKRIETRSWRTNHNGPIAIHAAKRFGSDDRWECWADEFKAALEPTGLIDYQAYEDLMPDSVERFGLPLGAIIAVALLVDVQPTSRLVANGLSDEELAFGNYDVGRYGFVIAQVQKLTVPIPCKGALGLWDVPADIEAQLTSAVR